MKNQKSSGLARCSSVLGLSLFFGLGVLGLHASSNLFEVTSYSGYPYLNGSISGVPAGANIEWEVTAYTGGYASAIIDGGGLNVYESRYDSGSVGDVTNTSYADTISYQLEAYAYQPNGGADTYLYVGW